MKSMMLIAVAGVLGLVLSGCVQEPQSGIISWNKNSVTNSYAADIPFTSVDGKESRFSEIRKPIALLAFTSPEARNCCSLKSELVELSKSLSYLPVTVVQISEPTSECPLGPGCHQSCDVNDGELVVLCDSSRIAWDAYHQPKINSVVLVDQNNRIVDVQSMSKLKSISDRALKLCEQVEKENSVYAIGD